MKITLSLLCVVLFLALAGCSSPESKDPTTTAEQTTEAATTLPEYTTSSAKSDVVSRIYNNCNTLYFEGSENLGSFTNSIDLPLLNFSSPGASSINSKILSDNKEAVDYFDKINENHFVLKTTKDEAKTYIVSHNWRSFDDMTVIEVDCESGLLNGEAKKSINIYYYDRLNDKELTFDEFLNRLSTTKEALFTVFTRANPKDSDFTVNSITGLFPDTDVRWHITFDNGSRSLSAEIKAQEATRPTPANLPA
ncbi:MAG: hypothetical protein K5643_03245 [Saccharofermentans sp.]|nr:hypothetical protein [Saccharofermentans sp.]